MADKLSEIVFLPPRIGMPWNGVEQPDHDLRIQRHGAEPISLPLPLMWIDPPWSIVNPSAADALASGIASVGVSVSALLSDLSSDAAPARFHDAANDELRSRILPYRPERYGLHSSDFDEVSIVDLRLTITRDQSGRFAFSPDQIARWESTNQGEPLAGGGWVPAATFPPDVASLDKLHSKINQLRALAQNAAVMVSLSPHRIEQDLAVVMQQKPDGLILRCNDPGISDPGISGLMIASTLRRARAWLDKHNHVTAQLWVDPGMISPADAVKLIHLGATGIAIDSWCEPLLDHLATTYQQSPSATGGFGSGRPLADGVVSAMVREMLWPDIDEFMGLTESLAVLPKQSRFAAVDPLWANTLQLPRLSFGIPSSL